MSDLLSRLHRKIYLPLVLFSALLAVVHASDNESRTPTEKFQISIDPRALTALPLWIHAELSGPLEVRYPYSPDLVDFGPNRLEVMRNGELLAPRKLKAWPAGSGLVDGSIAPTKSPRNRLPLHLAYPMAEPGKYSVRWTVVRHSVEKGRLVERVVARSDWLTFQVKPSTSEQRTRWLQEQLASVPRDPGLLVGDYLPSALSSASDVRVLRFVLQLLYSPDSVVTDIALASLQMFPEHEMAKEALEVLMQRGSCEAMAYLLSWHESLFHESEQQLVRTFVSEIDPVNGSRSADALKSLGFILHSPSSGWPADSQLTRWADEHVLAEAPALIMSDSEKTIRQLSEYLGGTKTERARDLLWRIIDRSGSEREQAMIALTWLGDPRDLPALSELLVTPGDSDSYGRDLSALPNSLSQVYGETAIPYLQKALSDSPYPFVRTQSAEELAIRNEAAAFSFFLDAVENDRFYKEEMVDWLKTRFPKQLQADADDIAVKAFLMARLTR